MLLKRITDGRASPPEAEQFFEKNLLFQCHWNTIRTRSELFERTTFLTFENHLKKLNC